MKLKLVLFLSFAFLTGFFAKAAATPPLDEVADGTKKSDILGGVYSNEKKPLSNVVVTAYLTSKKEKVVVTDGHGNYAFDDLKPGTYKFVFEKEGYKKVTKEKVVIRPDEGFELNIEMAEHANFDFIPGPHHFFDLELE